MLQNEKVSMAMNLPTPGSDDGVSELSSTLEAIKNSQLELAIPQAKAAANDNAKSGKTMKVDGINDEAEAELADDRKSRRNTAKDEDKDQPDEVDGQDNDNSASKSTKEEIDREHESTIEDESEEEDENEVAEELLDDVYEMRETLEERKPKIRKKGMQAASYLVLVSDVIKEMQGRLAKLEKTNAELETGTKNDETNASNTKEKVDKDVLSDADDTLSEENKFEKDGLVDPSTTTTATDRLTPKVKSMSWKRFIAPVFFNEPDEKFVIEVCNEPPHPLQPETSKRRRTRAYNAVTAHQVLSDNPSGRIERIRVRSKHINAIIEDELNVDASQGNREYRAHVAPFKALLSSKDLLRARYEQIATKKATDFAGEENIPEMEEKFEHLQCLIDFFNGAFKSHIDAYDQLRSTDNKMRRLKLSFSELWYLFHPGRLLYEPNDNQAWVVIAVKGGRQLLGNLEDRSTSLSMALNPGTFEESVSPFYIRAVRLEFDGAVTGVVQHDFEIAAFDGQKSITALTVYPIEYQDILQGQSSGMSLSPAPQTTDLRQTSSVEGSETNQVLEHLDTRAKLEKRGEIYAQHIGKERFYHREYNGFSLDSVREQIDSQIIIDSGWYYATHSEKPKLGAFEPESADVREVQESYMAPSKHCRNCTDFVWDKESSGWIYDDRVIDDALRRQFAQENQDLLRRITTTSTSQAYLHHYQHLFPRKIPGFVLRNRKWCMLDIDSMTELHKRQQGFSDLVLPPSHKRIVAALVKQTELAPNEDVNKVATSNTAKTASRNDDLVRGKGKGTIILLHGVPGVGKTSTAETVAEYARRPLFALTCGDIGNEATEVQKNLEENFRLAHRWRCVMLLDEADVYLAQRSKDDMKRNAVVSVFLRVLEYYPGILFLTTNKVGHFDEAFKSRIHVSLYYKELTAAQTKAIWTVNLNRIKGTRSLEVDEDDIMKWVKKKWCKKTAPQPNQPPQRTWNGRQIHNAVQTAAAIAEFGDEENLAVKTLTVKHLTVKHIKQVAKASEDFDKYLIAVHGNDDMYRAKQLGDRAEDAYATYVNTGALPGPQRTPSHPNVYGNVQPGASMIPPQQSTPSKKSKSGKKSKHHKSDDEDDEDDDGSDEEGSGDEVSDDAEDSD